MPPVLQVAEGDIATFKGDAVVNADRVEDKRHASGRTYLLLDVVPNLVQVRVARDDVDIRIDHRDKRFVAP